MSFESHPPPVLANQPLLGDRTDAQRFGAWFASMVSAHVHRHVSERMDAMDAALESALAQGSAQRLQELCSTTFYVATTEVQRKVDATSFANTGWAAALGDKAGGTSHAPRPDDPVDFDIDDLGAVSNYLLQAAGAQIRPAAQSEGAPAAPVPPSSGSPLTWLEPADGVPESAPIEVTMAELNQQTAQVVRKLVSDGRPAVVSRHGTYLAAIVPLRPGSVERSTSIRPVSKAQVRDRASEDADATITRDELRERVKTAHASSDQTTMA